MKSGINNLLEFDKAHVWHPYTSITSPLPVYLVERAKGVKIRLKDNRELIDGMSSWWSAIHGYNHPVINKVIKRQIKKMSHVMFGGFTHEPAIQLSKLLIDITPDVLDKVFLCDSGSVSVEVAMKMALQYFHAKNNTQKNKFLTIKKGYHGDTFNAMSVCDPVTGMHHIFKDVLPANYFADSPQCKFGEEWNPDDIEPVKNILIKHHEKIAAIILEPVVQGAGGMNFYNPQYLKEVKKLCTAYDTLLIFDEIATCFGRTGKLFACMHADVTPDILCLGKSLTGGYMTLASVLVNDNVSSTICNGDPGVFMHGPTFMGNPLACSTAIASINLLLSYNWQEKVRNIESQLKDELEKCRSLDEVNDVRVLGAIGVVETKYDINIGEIQKYFVEKGVWIRPFGKLIYIMPSYIIKNNELKKLTDSIYNVIKGKDKYDIFIGE